MQKVESITLDRNAAYHVAAIFDSFCRIEAADSQARKMLGHATFQDRVEACYSHWLTGTLFFSSQVRDVVDGMIDFEKWDIGVFSYEHLEFQESKCIHGCKSLPAYLWNNMSLQQWHSMACNFTPASAEWLERTVQAWAEEQNLPLKCSSDYGLTAAGLKAKYTISDSWGEHPKFARRCWQEEVSAGDVQSGYWDWVLSQVEQEAEETA